MANTPTHEVRVQGGVQGIVDVALAARDDHMCEVYLTVTHPDVSMDDYMAEVQPESVTLLSVTSCGGSQFTEYVLILNLEMDEAPPETLIVHAHSVPDEYYPPEQGGLLKSSKWEIIGCTGEFDGTTTLYHNGNQVVAP